PRSSSTSGLGGRPNPAPSVPIARSVARWSPTLATTRTARAPCCRSRATPIARSTRGGCAPRAPPRCRSRPAPAGSRARCIVHRGPIAGSSAARTTCADSRRNAKNTDLILINGANPAEAHPVGFQWFVQAKNDPKRGPGAGGGAKIIHADPRFTRTSALADIYARIRVGTDVAYFGGLINYVLQNSLSHDEYVRNYTNATFLVKPEYRFTDGLFSGYDPKNRKYDISSWGYQTDAAATTTVQAQLPAGSAPASIAKRDMTMQDPQTVFQLMKQHYARYTPDMVSRITGIPQDQFMRIAQLVGEMGKPDKVMTIVYAVGLTQHTTGGQLIRSGAVLQLLLGNMGRPGGGMNAERGHANIQGNTDHAISWEILPGYLRIPAPGQKTIDDYVKASAAKRSDPRS